MKRFGYFSSLASWAMLASGCQGQVSNSKTTMTMYFAETELSACDTVAGPPNAPLHIGNLTYLHYPHTGLLCVIGKRKQVVSAYRPAANRIATHRLIMESGSGQWGSKNTFEPHDPERSQP